MKPDEKHLTTTVYDGHTIFTRFVGMRFTRREQEDHADLHHHRVLMYLRANGLERLR